MQTIARGPGERGRFDYASLPADVVNRTADDALAEADRIVASVVASTAPRTFDTTLRPLSEAGALIWAADGIGTAIGYIHPDESVREASAAMEERSEQWRSGLARRDDLARAILDYATTEDADQLTGIRRRTLDLWLGDIRRGGHDLDPAAKAEFGRLLDRATEVAVTFGRNVTEWSDEVILGPDDLGGLSDSFVAQLPDGPEPGSRKLPITYAAVFPFIEQSTRRDLREVAYRRYYSRAVGVNETLLAELIDARRRAAAIVGRDSWSQFANEGRMSGGRSAVMEFLEGITGP